MPKRGVVTARVAEEGSDGSPEIRATYHHNEYLHQEIWTLKNSFQDVSVKSRGGAAVTIQRGTRCLGAAISFQNKAEIVKEGAMN